MTYAPTATAGLLLTLFTLFTSAGATPPARPGARPVLNEELRTTYMAAFEQHVARSYVQAGLIRTGLSLPVYRKALIGYYNLQQRGALKTAKPLLTIIDFSRASSQKRLWVINVAEPQVVFHTLVAHGKNTGEEWAKSFSNTEGSEKSSLGFYLTGNTYQGKHGLSLKLNGIDPGYNTNAASRAVVVHGADYVSEAFVRQHGRLGRSQGCPALPMAQSSAIIQVIKSGSVVFANGPTAVSYQSDLLQLDPALLAFARSKSLPGLPG
ncbi:murein L,D-transpeptidase catalytic domain family protein [Hymenobacter taeanensis]|uniref:Murein L,D-transpeptidase catalytic domain family protein n=1 Tax=Hymenobacter taeanensis TaxID=2735321 RepID=A0A6M6BL62_9BACT|nr:MULTISPECIES: murein L,D-transpeptidase catalytic domain family protein [Hymenobacter]QJX48564.1 murein L,D-transpeptidase catalytic domain family protein [Hymenobacter taeanensis]UOQ81940.1 murein L,D-transpeptidase catalytic domain family protein [Hymenobacter sp. 5414T-23]